MPINLTGPAMEVARIGSILKATKTKEAKATAGEVIDAIVTERKQSQAEPNNRMELTKTSEPTLLPAANWSAWNPAIAQKGLQSAAKAQEGKEASTNMRIAHKENVYKGGKRF